MKHCAMVTAQAKTAWREKMTSFSLTGLTPYGWSAKYSAWIGLTHRRPMLKTEYRKKPTTFRLRKSKLSPMTLGGGREILNL